MNAVKETSERKAFEKWCRENNGSPARLKGTDQYVVPVVQGAWTAWKARAKLESEFICTKCYLRQSGDREQPEF